MKNIYFLLFRNNCLYIKSNKNDKTLKYKFDDLNQYPNIPFYLTCFDYGVKDIKSFINSNLKCSNKLNDNIFKPIVYLLIPDDSIEIEKKILEEYVNKIFSPQKVYITYESMVISRKKELKYICISKTVRMLVLTYINNSKIEAKKYYNNIDYSIDELKNMISNLHEDCINLNINTYLNGINLSDFASLGVLIDNSTLLDSYYDYIVSKK